jgi:Concanavalin A-like lectin/glucanases superfamily/Secretion system C-terminal sorting domain
MKLKQLLLLAALLIITCFLSFSLFAQPTTVGLVAHFKLDGNTSNIGPANVTATAVSTSYTTNNANVASKALQLGGNLNSYIDFVDNGNVDFIGTNNFTVSFSFYFNGSTTSGLLDNCLNYGGWGIWLWSTIAGTWNLQFNYKNNSVGSAAATNFTIGSWHHVAAVRNNGTISLYIDGIFRLSATEGTTAPTYPINMIAGAMAYGSFSPPRYNPFGGKIDEIRIYNRALAAGEIGILAPFSLPLKLGDFTATKKSTIVELNWETITEQNTSYFEVERSSDGNNFSTIGRINAAGNSTDKLNYSYTDAAPLPKTNFYRLKMIDIDGSFNYSRIVIIKNNTGLLTMELFPNPVSDVLQLQLPNAKRETVIISITDAVGKIMYTRTTQLNEGNNAVSIPVLHLSKGMHYLSVDNSTTRQTKQFIKQ